MKISRLAARRPVLTVVLTLTLLTGATPVSVAFAQATSAQVTPVPVPMVALPDFTAIVERADPAVVNIRTTATVPSRSLTRDGQPGGDPYELFRFFFGPDFQPPGAEGRSRRGQQGDPPDEGRTVPRGQGSGFFISADGYILTNNHVVADAKDILVTLTDGREFKAKRVGGDERTDVALIKIEATSMATLPIGDPKNLKKGNWVLAIGSPFGLESTATAGIVSATGRDTGEYLPFIQTDVAVNPGNSGGPLLNLHGQVVGINSQIVSRSGGFMGISLAIPIDEAMRVQEQLKKSGKVTRGLIGVQIGEVSQEVAKALGLSKAQGALVSGVQAGSPADEAGVQPGDVILGFDGKEITRWNDLPRIVGATVPGTTGKLELWRKGKRLSKDVKVEEIPSVAAAAMGRAETKEASAKNALGIAAVNVPSETQRKLQIKGGVLVTQADGAAVEAGIAPKDIVLAINTTDITDVQQFDRVVSALPAGRRAAVLVRRGEHSQWVVVTPNK